MNTGKAMRIMKKLVVALMAMLALSTTAFAEDPMKAVFDQIDGLIIRVESGISLNSYAETFAGMKITFRKANEEPGRNKNYVLDDRMKEVFGLLDKYSKLWKEQETDNHWYTDSGDKACYVQLSRDSGVYDIKCQKQLVLSELKPLIDRSKSAHYDGW